jgi:hypothetical protein
VEEGLGGPFLEVGYALDLALSVIDHLDEEVGEGGAAELGILGAVEVAVVDGLLGGGVAQAGCRGARLRGDQALGGPRGRGTGHDVWEWDGDATGLGTVDVAVNNVLNRVVGVVVVSRVGGVILSNLNLPIFG